MSSNVFTSIEIDAIGEILNISLGASATAVSTMLSRRVDITTPNVKIISFDEFDYGDMEPAIGVEITYVSGLSGSNIMILKRHDVKVIVELLMQMEIAEEEFELNELNKSAVCEVMNQMMGASSTALSEFLGEVVNISTPISYEIEDPVEFKKKCFCGEQEMVVVNFHLKIEDLTESRFMYLMSNSLAKKLVSAFGLGSGDDTVVMNTESTPVSQPQQSAEQQTADVSGSNKVMTQDEIEAMIGGASTSPPSQEPMTQQVGASMNQNMQTPMQQPDMMGYQQQMPPQGYQMPPQGYQMPPQGYQMPPQGYQMPPQGYQMPPQGYQMPPQQRMINAQPLSTAQFGSPESLGEEQAENLALIMDVPLEISVEIGRTRRLIKDILELSSGSLVVLDKLAGEQVDIYANGQCIAKGDVVVVDDNFGVRITEIIKRPELLKEQQ